MLDMLDLDDLSPLSSYRAHARDVQHGRELLGALARDVGPLHVTDGAGGPAVAIAHQHQDQGQRRRDGGEQKQGPKKWHFLWVLNPAPFDFCSSVTFECGIVFPQC